VKIVYDPKLMKVGCVLLQATHGCDPALAHRFGTEDWILAPTDDMGVFPVTEDQLDQLVEMTKDAR
jgi:hypothetical protein